MLGVVLARSSRSVARLDEVAIGSALRVGLATEEECQFAPKVYHRVGSRCKTFQV